MKRFFKTFTSLLLVFVMCLSVGLLAACAVEEDFEEQSTESEQPVEEAEKLPDTNLTPEDRSEYSMANAVNAITDASVYDFLASFGAENSVFSLLDGYLAGDVYDIAIDYIAVYAANQDVNFQINFDVFKFTKNEDGKWVCVAINYSDEPQDFQLNLSDKKKLRWQIYRTSDAEGENLKPIGICKGKTQLSARSISTFVEK